MKVCLRENNQLSKKSKKLCDSCVKSGLDPYFTYLEASFEESKGDASFVAKALGDIARARGMTQVARDAGLSREGLYKTLSGERTPGFDTILKVVQALGIELHAVPLQT